MLFATEARGVSGPPRPCWGTHTHTPHLYAGGTRAGSLVTVSKPLPSLNNPDGMLLLHQHGQFSGHLKYVLTLQNGIPLWRQVPEGSGRVV